jgi:hypothetical protein
MSVDNLAKTRYMKTKLDFTREEAQNVDCQKSDHAKP